MSEPSKSTLNLPNIESVEFAKNFIRTAVCELRFPALLEFETATPVQLQRELRKEFPLYERQQLNLAPDLLSKETKHVFKSKKSDWTVAFKTSAISLETTKYKTFEDFLDRLKMLLSRSQSLLDTDFFTRVGLRYINEIPIGDGSLTEWIRPELVTPLVEGTYGDVIRFFQEVRGSARIGKYSFRHGFANLENRETKTYTVDFDFYDENVQFDSVISMVTEFNKESFRFFNWAIGLKTREQLGEKRIKKEE